MTVTVLSHRFIGRSTGAWSRLPARTGGGRGAGAGVRACRRAGQHPGRRLGDQHAVLHQMLHGWSIILSKVTDRAPGAGQVPASETMTPGRPPAPRYAAQTTDIRLTGPYWSALTGPSRNVQRVASDQTTGAPEGSAEFCARPRLNGSPLARTAFANTLRHEHAFPATASVRARPYGGPPQTTDPAKSQGKDLCGAECRGRVTDVRARWCALRTQRGCTNVRIL